METLYDMLGALPRDDAEALRTAFRQAVKGAHPDLNPGDPEAGRKFRQIVRAQEILLDGEQRAVYDHLLELARVEAAEDAKLASDSARAGKIHRLASWVMAVAGASAVSIGGLAVVALLWTSTEPAADAGPVADSPAPTKVAIATDVPATAPTTEPAAAAPTPAADTADGAPPPLAPPLDITPTPETVAFERMRGFDRAFADVTHLKHPDKPAHAIGPRKKGPIQAAAEVNAKPTPPMPLPPRRTAAYDASRQESAAFVARP
jgi:hypothetical protein